jgi:hypothetical protein
VNLSISGVGYANSGPVDGAGFTIASDVSGVSSVSGVGTLPGIGGGTATVSMNIGRFFSWSFGKITVTDPARGINLTGYAFFGPQMVKTGSSSTISGSWFTFVAGRGFVPFTITATITDNV